MLADCLYELNAVKTNAEIAQYVETLNNIRTQLNPKRKGHLVELNKKKYVKDNMKKIRQKLTFIHPFHFWTGDPSFQPPPRP